MDQISFAVGQRHENLKGVYEVLSVDGEAMRIRWVDSGEEIDTTVYQQRRIQEYVLRQQRDRMTPSAGKRSSSLRGYGELFQGLVDTDFKEDVTGTAWRSRQQLGGAVTKLLISESAAFESWSLYHRTEVHWADIGHRGRDEAWLQAKFACFLNADRMLCGFYIERSDDPSSPGEDWGRFITWLSDGDHAQQLHDVMRTHQLKIRELWDRFPACLSPSPSAPTWIVTDGTGCSEAPMEYRTGFLGSLPLTEWVDLVICREFAKTEAVGQGAKLGMDIAATFNCLVPVYEFVARLGQSSAR